MNYQLTEQQLRDGMKICLDHIKSLITQSEIIFEKIPDSSFGLGLYTFAVEELGKLLLLQDALSTPKNADDTFNVKMEIFGRGRSHPQIKFQKILPLLPDKCKKIGGIVGAITGTHPPSFVGIFRYTEPDFEMRKEFFYVDWDDVNKKWKAPLKRDQAHIRTAVNELKMWIDQNIHL